MDFLGIGPLELIVILVIALIVVGPDKLPEIARSIGKTARQIRAISSTFTSEWQRELTAATQDIRVDELKQTLVEPLSDASTGVQQVLDSTARSVSTSVAGGMAPPGGFVPTPSAKPVPQPETPTTTEDNEPQLSSEQVVSAEPQPIPVLPETSVVPEEEANADA